MILIGNLLVILIGVLFYSEILINLIKHKFKPQARDRLETISKYLQIGSFSIIVFMCLSVMLIAINEISKVIQ